jgi:hypothetical protein
MFPVPTISELSDFTGIPQQSFTGFAQNALIQATVMFTAVTELVNANNLDADDYLLAKMGINAMAAYVYFRQPYQQAIAGPFMNETIGSYSYGKAMTELARNAQGAEVNSEATGVTMYDLAVRMLSLRTRAGGVFTGGVTLFERTTGIGEDGDARGFNDAGRMAVRFDGAGMFVTRGVFEGENRFIVRGPDEFNQLDLQMFDYNSEMFPSDPGVG